MYDAGARPHPRFVPIAFDRRSSLVDDSPVALDLYSIIVVALLVAVPVHNRRQPFACGLFAAERPAEAIGPIFRRAEQRFQVRVVVRYPWPGEGFEHAQLLQPALQGGRMHGVAATGMTINGRWRPLLFRSRR